MKNQTYQLSAQGIGRLEKFKRDVLAGDFVVREERALPSDIEPLYFVVSNIDSTNCAFTRNQNEIINYTLRDIDESLNATVEKRLHDCGNIFYCSSGYYGVALNRTDITTPAQRALESLAKRLNQGSYANA